MAVVGGTGGQEGRRNHLTSALATTRFYLASGGRGKREVGGGGPFTSQVESEASAAFLPSIFLPSSQLGGSRFTRGKEGDSTKNRQKSQTHIKWLYVGNYQTLPFLFLNYSSNPLLDHPSEEIHPLLLLLRRRLFPLRPSFLLLLYLHLCCSVPLSSALLIIAAASGMKEEGEEGEAFLPFGTRDVGCG